VRVSASAPDHLEASTSVEAKAGLTATVDLVLQKLPPDSVVVAGRVTDAQSGNAIPYASVSAENQRWGTYNGTTTDAQGNYEMRIKPDYTILTISAYKYYSPPCQATVEPAKGEATATASTSSGQAAPGTAMPRPCT